MNTDIYELAANQLIGEELTVQEKTRLQKRNAKYELVRFLYLEKMKVLGLTNFQFTPGDEFETTPTIDIVNTLVNIMEDIIKNTTPLDFGDSHWIDNPPNTGQTKTALK